VPKNQSILKTHVFNKKENPDDFIRILFYLMKNGPSTDTQIVKSLDLRKDRVGKIKEEFLKENLIMYDKESKSVNFENVDQLLISKTTNKQKEDIKKAVRRYSRDPYGITLLGVLLLAEEKGFNSKYIFKKKVFNGIFNAKFTDQELSVVQSIFVHKEFSKVLQLGVKNIIMNIGKEKFKKEIEKAGSLDVIDFHGSNLNQINPGWKGNRNHPIFEEIFRETILSEEFRKRQGNCINIEKIFEVLDFIDKSVKNKWKSTIIKMLKQTVENQENKIKEEKEVLRQQKELIKMFERDLNKL
jgi:hypothetical protein